LTDKIAVSFVLLFILEYKNPKIQRRIMIKKIIFAFMMIEDYKSSIVNPFSMFHMTLY
ncbi:MAG: hypothetical protein RL023_514, partial [Candidatus Parcubacteria bacterium]